MDPTNAKSIEKVRNYYEKIVNESISPKDRAKFAMKLAELEK